MCISILTGSAFSVNTYEMYQRINMYVYEYMRKNSKREQRENRFRMYNLLHDYDSSLGICYSINKMIPQRDPYGVKECVLERGRERERETFARGGALDVASVVVTIHVG